MGSGKMDEKAAKRIAAARGKNDPFAKRAELACRNRKDWEAEGGGSIMDGTWRKSSDSSGSKNSGRRAK